MNRRAYDLYCAVLDFQFPDRENNDDVIQPAQETIQHLRALRDGSGESEMDHIERLERENAELRALLAEKEGR